MIIAKNHRTSLLDTARNETMAHIDPEVTRVLDNIADINCDPDAKRSVTLRLDFVPAGAGVFALKISSKSVLASAPATECLMRAEKLLGRGPWRIENVGAPVLPGQLTVDGGQEDVEVEEMQQ